MTSVESQLKLVEQVDFKGSFTDEEFASYRKMFMVSPSICPVHSCLKYH